MLLSNKGFEFDPIKSSANKEKHGIDFVEAQKLWLDPKAKDTIVRTSFNEERKGMIALYKDKIWVIIFTMRSTKIRLISVRRARKKEQEKYYA